LEPRGWKEIVAEVEKVERSHRFEHAELVDQQGLDFGDAVKPSHDGAEILLWNHLLAEDVATAVQVVEELLEPKLVGLMDDDKEHFIVRDDSALRKRLGLLAVEDRVQLKIVVIVDRLRSSLGANRS